MNKVTKISIATLAVAFVGIIITVICLNINSIKAAANGAILYTYDDVLAANKSGYEEGLGRREYYESIIAELQQTIIDNEIAAQEKYDDMVAEFEKKIAALNAELARKVEYCWQLESYIINFNFDSTGSTTSLAALNLQLTAYETIKTNIKADIVHWTDVLSELPDVGELNSKRDAYIVESVELPSLLTYYTEQVRRYEIARDFVYNWQKNPGTSTDIRLLNPATGIVYTLGIGFFGTNNDIWSRYFKTEGVDGLDLYYGHSGDGYYTLDLGSYYSANKGNGYVDGVPDLLRSYLFRCMPFMESECSPFLDLDIATFSLNYAHFKDKLLEYTTKSQTYPTLIDSLEEQIRNVSTQIGIAEHIISSSEESLIVVDERIAELKERIAQLGQSEEGDNL